MSNNINVNKKSKQVQTEYPLVEHLEEIKKAVESVVGKEVKISIALSKEPSGSVKNPYPDLTKIIKKIPVELLDE